MTTGKEVSDITIDTLAMNKLDTYLLHTSLIQCCFRDKHLHTVP